MKDKPWGIRVLVPEFNHHVRRILALYEEQSLELHQGNGQLATSQPSLGQRLLNRVTVGHLMAVTLAIGMAGGAGMHAGLQSMDQEQPTTYNFYQLAPATLVQEAPACEAPGLLGVLVNDSGARGYWTHGRVFHGPTCDRGVAVVDVMADSPARAAGLEDGDRIVGLNHRRVDSARGLARAIQTSCSGDTLDIDILRHGKHKHVRAQLAGFAKDDR